MGGCPHCTTISDLKRTIPLGVPLLVLGYFVAPWREYLPDAINEPLKKFIIAAIFLIGLIVLGYVFFAHDGVSSNITAHFGGTASTDFSLNVGVHIRCF